MQSIERLKTVMSQSNLQAPQPSSIKQQKTLLNNRFVGAQSIDNLHYEPDEIIRQTEQKIRLNKNQSTDNFQLNFQQSKKLRNFDVENNRFEFNKSILDQDKENKTITLKKLN